MSPSPLSSLTLVPIITPLLPWPEDPDPSLWLSGIVDVYTFKVGGAVPTQYT